MRRKRNDKEIRAIVLPEEDYNGPIMDQLVPEEAKPQVKWKQWYKTIWYKTIWYKTKWYKTWT